MEQPKQDGGAAFPGHANRPASMAPGMSLRDYFAGQALGGRLAQGQWEDTLAMKAWAKWCYQQADEMIAAREGGPSDASD